MTEPSKIPQVCVFPPCTSGPFYATFSYTDDIADGFFAAGLDDAGEDFSATGTLTLLKAASVGVFEGSGVSGVPEPSTWAMMLAGFAFLGYAGYRARRSAAAPAF